MLEGKARARAHLPLEALGDFHDEGCWYGGARSGLQHQFIRYGGAQVHACRSCRFICGKRQIGSVGQAKDANGFCHSRFMAVGLRRVNSCWDDAIG